MKLNAKKTSIKLKNTDNLVIFLTKEDAENKDYSFPAPAGFLNGLISIDTFEGPEGETLFVPAVQGPSAIICGRGAQDECTEELLRKAASAAINLASSKKLEDITFLVPQNLPFEEEKCLKAVIEGTVLANYSADFYKSEDESKKTLLKKISFMTDIKNAPSIIKESEIICINTLKCRDLINRNSDETTPDMIAKEAEKISELTGVTCKIYNFSELKKMKMGLLLAVNRGSARKAKMVTLTYKGAPSSKENTALVGKGITFDSGGLNLKPSGSIETMRMDMSGAAAVLYAFKTAAELKLKKNISAVIPLTDNLLSEKSYRPGDVFKSYSGKTVEIGNTDAEGRLILADALTFTEKKLKATTIIDCATLTGACLVALGETVAAFLTEDDTLAKDLFDAGEKTGDRLWRLPLYSEYDETIKSETADMRNIAADRQAGTIVGAVFLKRFIEKASWAHIDIAGTAWYSKARGYRPKNATGYGVRLLTEFLSR